MYSMAKRIFVVVWEFSIRSGEVRSGLGTYDGVVLRRIQSEAVFLLPPSGDRQRRPKAQRQVNKRFKKAIALDYKDSVYENETCC